MILAQKLTKTFGGRNVVRDMTFTIDRGEIVALLGPNGAGKTTTMRLLTGFLYPDAGRVLIDNVDMASEPALCQKKIGYLPENNPLYTDLLVSEHLHYMADLKGVPAEKKTTAIDEVVQKLSLTDVYYRIVGELSKGYKQRVGIAGALLHKPSILILDEPTEGLDPNQRGDMRSLIVDLAKDRTVIISTHVLQEAQAIANRIMIINDGTLVADKPKADLLKKHTETFTVIAEVEAKDIENDLEKDDSDMEYEILSIEKEGRATIRLSAKQPVQPLLSSLAAQNHWTIWRLSEEENTLERVFEELTK